MRTALVFTLLSSIAVPAFNSDVPPQGIRQLFAAYDKPNSPGCSVGVIRDGKFLYRESYGAASLELGVPLTSQSVFYMASVSKQFTAASVVLAAEQGRLALDDDVRKYIPELPDYGHPITLRQMLHHTSGLRDFLSLVYLSGRDISNLASSGEVLKLIVRQKGLNNVPGAEFIYSNSNYFLLGVVIQRATKKSLAEFAAQNIFQPLGMAHTLYYDDNTLVVPGRVAAYDPGENGKYKVDWSTTYDIVGGGGLMSTVDDLLLWDNNFYADKLGKGGLIRELSNRGVLNDGKQINYAMGLWLGTYRGAQTVEHSGGTFGYRTELLRFPLQHFSVIALCNVSNANVEGLSRQVAALFLGWDTSAGTQGSGQRNPSRPRAVRRHVSRSPNACRLHLHGCGRKLTAWGSALRRFGPNQFNDLVGNPITFEEKNSVMSARLDLEGETYFAGNKVRALQLSQAALNAFAGEYRSDELDANYKLTVEQGNLTLKIRDQVPIKLNSISPAEFQAGDLGTIVFHTDTRHRISELTLFSQAARGITFRKVG